VISHCTITYGEYCAINVFIIGSPEISHCTIIHNQSGIYWQSPDDGTISDCIVRHNLNGGGIRLCEYAKLTIVDCIISDNTNDERGGGVRSDLGALNVINCTISDNTSSHNRGGGISCTYGTHTFTNCTINGNVCYDQHTALGGGGISLYYASATLAYCSIYDNYAVDGGAGIMITNSNLTVDHCTIDGNESWSGNVSGISIINGSTADITNSIISNNFYGYGIYNSGTLTVEYTDLFNNTTGAINGNIPIGFGELTQVNVNSDSCDVYYNIFLDPLYVDQANFDLNLTENSPCIDAGDPSSPLDPDGTVTDMGRYYFDQSPPGIPSTVTGLTISCDSLNAHLTWSPVTTDTSGNPITVSQYIIYSSQEPNFIPASSDSIGFTTPPDTSFIDIDPRTEPKQFYNVKANTYDP
jgi:hypothetical protein